MCFEDKVKLFIKYIKGLRDFNVVKPDTSVPYKHVIPAILPNISIP